MAGTGIIPSYTQSSVVKDTEIVLRNSIIFGSGFFIPIAGTSIVLSYTQPLVVKEAKSVLGINIALLCQWQK